MGDQMPREVEDADRILDTLFGGDDPDTGTEDRLWLRVQSELGPQAQPWRARLRGLFGGSVLGLPMRRAAMVGGLAAVMVAAVLIVPSLGGNNASAAILEAVDDLSTATSDALSDDDLSASELRDLRERADSLLRRIQDNPAALGDLDLTDLSAAIASLQAVEALLVDQPAVTDASGVVAQVGQAAQQAEDALQSRDPDSPLLAATVTRDPATATDLANGRRSFAVGAAGSVIIEVRDGSLDLVATRPASGWNARVDKVERDEIEVRFESGDGARIDFEAELNDGRLATSIDQSDSGGSSNSGTANPSATATPNATSTPGATATPGATSTPAATSTPGATATPGATSTPTATGTPGAGRTSGGTVALGSGTQSINVGAGGSVVLDTDGGLTLVSATPAGGWVIVRQDVESDRIEVRFGQGTTQWRIDARLEGGQIDYEVSEHLNEDPAGSSADDNG